MRKLVFILALLLVAVSGFPFSSTAATGNSCTTCREQCRDEGIQKELDCLVNPSETFETCKAKYFQYVNSCTSVFCNYGGLCQFEID